MRTPSHALAITLVSILGASLTTRDAAAQQPAPPAPSLEVTRELNLEAYTQLMRSDIRAQKTAIIAELVPMTEAEDAKFWPVYRDYETKLSKINDDRLALITEYAKVYDHIDNAVADRLITSALDLESRRQALKADYYKQLKTAVSPKTAARVLQVENQILLLLDLQIAASLPIVE